MSEHKVLYLFLLRGHSKSTYASRGGRGSSKSEQKRTGNWGEGGSYIIVRSLQKKSIPI